MAGEMDAALPDLDPPTVLRRAPADELPGWSLRPVLLWLLAEGRHAGELVALVDGVASRLLEAGAPLWRLRVGLRTLHPQVRAMSAVWLRGQGASMTPACCTRSS